ncbi:tail fiber domain-containing protein [Aquimarina sp. MMG016]|uniref:tail fiber domain-containing protein n=1 Tax=Aquimarina sp. MMG016 TaxID=2822690 RepID=UPI001B3A724F|nr:tail fiber domain-containing protein [Aquimarina sp. MMG016]MBQ4821714.1 tail fiber domain-containing protein [Aquimarina sp. MMG016]
MKQVLLILTIICGIVAQAQSPELFNYQAVIKDNNGDVIANQNVSFQFEIIKNSTGAAVFTETQNVTTTENGLASLRIGNSFQLKGTGVLSGIDWSDGPYKLEISIDETGGSNYSLLGSTILTSVPYAMHADTVEEGDNLGDHMVTQNINLGTTNYISPDGSDAGISFNAGGDVLITDTDTFSNLRIQNTNASSISNIEIGVPTATWNIRIQDNQFVISEDETENNNIYIEEGSAERLQHDIHIDAEGRVGIATSQPYQDPNVKLDVNGKIRIGTTDIGNGRVLVSDADGIGTWTDPNTLGLGGSGAFSTTSGVTSNVSQTEETDDFVFGSSQLEDDANTDHDYRMFFDKSKGAFRVGRVTSTAWDDVNRGDQSIALGYNTVSSGNYAFAVGDINIASGNASTVIGSENVASGEFSFAGGSNTNASGFASFAFGTNTEANANYSKSISFNGNTSSYAETVLGTYNTNATGQTTTFWVATDRLFTIGNGDMESNRSDALVILKNGNTEINGTLTIDANNDDSGYTFPANSPTPGQTIGVNGAGALEWVIPEAGASDKRWKENIVPISGALSKLDQINGYYYDWKDKRDPNRQVGVIAQEIESILPEAVYSDDKGYKYVNYQLLTALLIQVNKEQETKIKALEFQMQKIEELTVLVNNVLQKEKEKLSSNGFSTKE